MRLSLVSLVVLSYSATATQLCKELNGSENTSLIDVNSQEGFSCSGSQNSNVKSRSEESIAGNNVINKRAGVSEPDLEIAKEGALGQPSEIAEENGDPNIIDENSQNLKALDNGDLEQNSQGLETGCGDSMGEDMKKDQNKRDMTKSCGAPKSANIEKPTAECSSCKMKEDAMKKEMDKVKEDVKKDEKPMAECNTCSKKEDTTKKEDTKKDSTMKEEKPMVECNTCNKKEDATKASPPPVTIPPMEKPMTECNTCNKKEDAKKAPPPPAVANPPAEKPMTECNACNKKEDAKKAPPPPPAVANPPAEKPIAECNGNGSCSKKDGASKPPAAPKDIPPPVAKPPNPPLPTSGPMSPSMSAPMPNNNTVVIVVENHIAPCSVCQEKSQGGNSPPNPGPVPTGTPKVDAKPPSPQPKSQPPPQPKSQPPPEEPAPVPQTPQLKSQPQAPQPQAQAPQAPQAPQPDTKSDSKSTIKPDVNLPKAPAPSSAPKSNTDKATLPIFTGDAMTTSLRSTTLNIVLLLFFFTTFFNLGGNVMLN